VTSERDLGLDRDLEPDASAFEHAGASARKTALAGAIDEIFEGRSVVHWLPRGPAAMANAG